MHICTSYLRLNLSSYCDNKTFLGKKLVHLPSEENNKQQAITVCHVMTQEAQTYMDPEKKLE